MKLTYTKLKQHSMKNFHLVTNERGEEVAFFWRPNNTRTDKNAWRLYVHNRLLNNPSKDGGDFKMVDHAWTAPEAKKRIETYIHLFEVRMKNY